MRTLLTALLVLSTTVCNAQDNKPVGEDKVKAYRTTVGVRRVVDSKNAIVMTQHFGDHTPHYWIEADTTDWEYDTAMPGGTGTKNLTCHGRKADR